VTCGDATIRMCLSAPPVCGVAYRRALARRLGLDAQETGALLHVVAAGRLTAAELSAALVLPDGEVSALVERLVAGGRLVRSAGDVIEVAPPEAERLAELMRPLNQDLDALAERFSPDERAVVGRFLEAVVDVTERHAREAAQRALAGGEPPLRST
jgi:DNA-binding MarR family transcriptional regulator